MSHHFKETPHNAITDSGIARVIPCKELDVGDPIKWLSLGLRDLLRAPGITVFYGILFCADSSFYYLFSRDDRMAPGNFASHSCLYVNWAFLGCRTLRRQLGI